MKSERLSTLDEYGGRRFVIPGEAEGPFRRWRTRVYSILLVIFLALPWIKINGLQAVWIDIPRRRFEIFGKLFLAHDAPLIFLLVLIAVMLLAYVTAVWGRVWCGWACPQTVFIDAVYRRIEIWTEGTYIQRRALRSQPLSWNKIRRVGLKWFLYIIASSIIAHSFIAYFAGSDNLLNMVKSSPEGHWTYFVLVSVITGLLLFNFAWFREQFCTIMCPYGRFQSVLMDNDTVNIAYDEARGEPRKDKTVAADKRGDCVACNRCVVVCPAAIDIRDGVQMECIGCTACIDACNVIMEKVGKPKDLIRYQSVNVKGARPWRGRALAYLAIAAISAIVLVREIQDHALYSITVLRGQDIPYQILPDGMVLNHLKVHLMNQSEHAQVFILNLDQDALAKGASMTQAVPVNAIAAGQDAEVHVFVRAPRALFAKAGQLKINLNIKEQTLQAVETKEIMMVGPQ